MWKEYANCFNLYEDDAELYSWFFGEDESLTAHQQHARARMMCFTCPVQVHCLREALRTDEGNAVWGGFTPSQRRRYIAPKVRGDFSREKLAAAILKVGGKFMAKMEERGLPTNRSRLHEVAAGGYPPLPDLD